MSIKFERYLFLDVGDTLMSLNRPAGEIYFEVLSKFGITQKPKLNLEKAFRLAYAEMTRNPLPDFQDKFHVHQDGSKGWWRDLLSIFLEKIGSDVSPDSIAESIFEKFDDPRLWDLDPGFREVLEFTQQNQFGLGIISNWDHRLRDLLKSVGVAQYFNPIFVSAEFGYEKPSPRIFEAAERAVGLDPKNLIYCGDKVEFDIVPTRERGWTAFQKHAEGEISSLSELPRLLEPTLKI
ncbi:hydrolase [Leptospira perolatii]|uniref:Hydrolase n=1 Tax=Leptospira perolatii TaxID=2023191 RepID=A0A2M9ZSW6_9LEPT|nr:HAD-IA family hydrolase [Leptospira perolatii]PJZ68750.1 hydrolase [Leptospira perolatii]PJZ75105.1 hydrolase [Leptospira perolatii]